MTPPLNGRTPVPPARVLLCFHAHPDDEVFTTGGVMRLAADAGHRVVLVTATDGALGEVPEGLLAEGERLVDRRRRELETSARALGVHRLDRAIHLSRLHWCDALPRLAGWCPVPAFARRVPVMVR